MHTSKSALGDADVLRLMNEAFSGLRGDEERWHGFERETALWDSASGDALEDDTSS